MVTRWHGQMTLVECPKHSYHVQIVASNVATLRIIEE